MLRSLVHVSVGMPKNMETVGMVCSWYSEHEKLAEFIEYIVRREVVSNLDGPELIFDSNSSLDVTMKCFMKHEMQEEYTIIVEELIQSIRKNKHKLTVCSVVLVLSTHDVGG